VIGGGDVVTRGVSVLDHEPTACPSAVSATEAPI